jgi:hypothetical protein
MINSQHTLDLDNERVSIFYSRRKATNVFFDNVIGLFT